MDGWKRVVNGITSFLSGTSLAALFPSRYSFNRPSTALIVHPALRRLQIQLNVRLEESTDLQRETSYTTSESWLELKRRSAPTL